MLGSIAGPGLLLLTWKAELLVSRGVVTSYKRTFEGVFGTFRVLEGPFPIRAVRQILRLVHLLSK